MKYVILDIDGCCLDNAERIDHLHAGDLETFYLEWEKDKPIEQGVLVYSMLMDNPEIECVFVTARPEQVRLQTLAHLTILFGAQRIEKCKLLMRPNKDQRIDTELKLNLILESGIDFKDVFLCFDDRLSVIEAYRNNGMIAYQTNAGW